MFCKYCGKAAADDSDACANCGAILNYKDEKGGLRADYLITKKKENEPVWALDEREKKPARGFISFLGPFGFISLAVLCVFIGHHRMYFGQQIIPALVLYAAGAVFVILARTASRQQASKNILSFKTEIFMFIFIVFLAVFFRLHMIQSIPAGLYADEARNGEVAIGIMQGEEVEGQKLPVYVGERSPENAAMYNYFIAVFFKILGANTDNIRIATAFLGILSVPAFYFVLRYLFGAGAAVLGGFLFAGMSWHVTFSRIGFHAASAVFLFVLVLYFLFRAYKERKWGDFMILGAVLALSQNTYIAARSIPLLVLLFAFYVLVREPEFYRANLKKISVCMAAAFIVFLPMLGYIIKHPDRYMGRAGTVSILNEDTVKKFYHGRYTVKERLKENIKEHFLMFGLKGDANPRHNKPGRPMLDYITGALAVLGAAYMMLRIFSPLGFLSAAGFIIFITPGILTIEAPQSLRTILLVVILIILASVSLKKIIDYAGEQFGEKCRITVFISALLLVFAGGAANYDRYFNDYAEDPAVWEAFSTAEYIGGKLIAEKTEGWTAVVNKNIFYAPGYTFRYFKNRHINIPVEHFNTFEHLPYSEKTEKGVIYLLSYEEKVYVDTFMKDIYPGGKYSEIKPPHGGARPLFIVYEVPARDINKNINSELKNGITGSYYTGSEFFPGRLRLKRTDPNIDFKWHTRPLRSGDFAAEWKGSIIADKDGKYYFRTASNGYNEVVINGEKIIENRKTRRVSGAAGAAVLKKGENKIRVRYINNTDGSRMHLYWRTPDENGYRAVPYENFRPEE